MSPLYSLFRFSPALFITLASFTVPLTAQATTPHDPFYCLDCHTIWGTSNITFVSESVVTPNSGVKPVVFLSYNGTSSFADGDSTYDGICEVCHTTTAYHRNTSEGDQSHYPAMNCITCHPHEDNFMPLPNP